MIDTTEQTTCLACGAPLIQIAGRGHRKKLYCNDTCRQKAHRRQAQSKVTPVVTNDDLQQRIAELEQELAEARKLQKMWEEQYDGEARYHTDTRVRHFKYWLRQHPKPNDTDFFKRFLADRRINESASRSMYEARLRLNGYSEEDIALFHVAWRDMLFFDRG